MKFILLLFPDSEKRPDLYKKWLRFLNRKEEFPKGYTGTAVKLWKPGKNSGICSKHFEEHFLSVGKRTQL